MPDTHPGPVTSWIQSLRARVDAGELGMTAEELRDIELEASARQQHQANLTRDRRLDMLQRRLPEHYDWARQHKRDAWTKIRRDLRDTLARRPKAWVLLGTPVGNAKTTALAYEAARAICTGRSVRYVASSLDWRKAIKDESNAMLRDFEVCDLLLVDELHWLARLPDWIVAEAMGVIDARYRQRRYRQTIGAGSLPIAQLTNQLPPGLADRFQVHLGAAEESQRRSEK